MTTPGSLVVVGVGIRAHGHLTADARHFLERADEVVYVISDQIAERMLRDLRPDARSLHPLYSEDKPRAQTYEEMVEAMLAPVRAGKLVCGAFYGHPGVCADSPHAAVARARAEGFSAIMLPAVSSLDCLWADLGVDPTDAGVQIYEATRFLLTRVAPNRAAGLILLQLGTIGEAGYLRHGIKREGLEVLAGELARQYGAGHPCAVYEVATLLTSPRHAHWITLGELGRADVPFMSTLWVPPARPGRADPRMLRRLGL